MSCVHTVVIIYRQLRSPLLRCIICKKKLNDMSKRLSCMVTSHQNWFLCFWIICQNVCQDWWCPIRFENFSQPSCKECCSIRHRHMGFCAKCHMCAMLPLMSISSTCHVKLSTSEVANLWLQLLTVVGCVSCPKLSELLFCSSFLVCASTHCQISTVINPNQVTSMPVGILSQPSKVVQIWQVRDILWIYQQFVPMFCNRPLL